MKELLLVFSLFTFHFSLSAQGWLWGKYGIGDASTEVIRADNYGNCYLAGEFPADTIHFGTYTLMNSNSPNLFYYNGFIVKYNSKGQLQWARQTIGRDTSKKHYDLAPFTAAVDNKGNAYLDVNYTDTLLAGAYNIVSNHGLGSTSIVKYDSNGNVKWIRTSKNCIHTDSIIAGGDWVSCDKFGNIFLLGAASYDSVHFGSFTLFYYHNLNWNGFLVKYDSLGNVKWAKQAIPKSINSASASYCITNDNFGNSFITGGFVDTVQYGPYILKNNNHIDFEIVKYDSAGNVLWAKQSQTPSSSSTCEGWGVTTDKFGNAYVCGGFTDTVVFGQDTIRDPVLGRGNFFVTKYSPAGNVIWAKQATILDTNNWTAWSISSDNHGHLFLSANGGYNRCKVAFGGDTLSLNDTAKHDGASLIYKLDTNGKALCGAIIPAGTQGGGFYTGISSDTSGKYVFVGGIASTEVIFGKDTVNPYSVPTDPVEGLNWFPFAARWEECDTSIITAVPQQLPVNSKLLVYPNPNNGVFNILMEQAEPCKVEVYDVFGQEVYAGNINSKNAQINLENKAAGIYFYRITNETGSLLGEGKAIIQR